MSFEDESNTFKILVATDIHLGFKERDPVRGKDSLNTFEEILQIARDSEVDFILLGGDLFHDNKPSRSTLHGCLALLRKYCMGDKPIHFEYLSDQSIDFKHCTFPNVNYEEPNFNISIPVFSIHGNQDDPTGPGNLCSLDLLHTAGLVNYFGKATSLDKIQISPLRLQKGETKIALYGLGSVRDERLHRMFLKEKVSFSKDGQENWFNVFAIHQNRVPHTPTNYIPENYLEDFIDLVVWGHEHECLLTDQRPIRSSKQNLSICQPGSSIATSLKEAEAEPKNIGILKINGKKFQMTPIPLMTVRQLYIEHINLKECMQYDVEDPKLRAETICTDKVEEILREASKECTPKQPSLPLVRLIIDYTDFDPFSSQRDRKKSTDGSDKSISVLNGDSVEDMIQKNMSENGLTLLCVEDMNKALKDRIFNDDVQAIETLVKSTLKSIQNDLQQCNTLEENSEALKFKIQEIRKAQTSKPSTANQTIGLKHEEMKDSEKQIASQEPYTNITGVITNIDSQMRVQNNNTSLTQCQGTSSNVTDAVYSVTPNQGISNISITATSTKKCTQESKTKKASLNTFPQLSSSCSVPSKKGSKEEPIVLDDSEEEDFSDHMRAQQKTKTSTNKRGITNSDVSEEGLKVTSETGGNGEKSSLGK
ncbi:meiotic recombination [Bulinus truncatus]|nr:meiotic recombination [Bulinus truncatus]